ncbi:hypothetical protein H2198_005058 [Neophaeococcomyces mojaviensis]|uniref:Uncharacterized protein n=1 Tax=Neophaeococcomyces mojaviensis TaxID=3383035 RepID=A0ACC3A6R2_9EURO|nr:hypothetical protein H2198_005058 [Knufia sp. JES_112]
MDRPSSAVSKRERLLTQRIRGLKHHLAQSKASEAKAGWERAQLVRQLADLQDRAAKSEEGELLSEKAKNSLQRQLEEQIGENARLKQELEKAGREANDRAHENSQLRNVTTRAENIALDLLRRHMSSSMVATVYNDESVDDRLTMLQVHLQRRHEAHEQRLQGLQDEVDAQTEQNIQLRQALDDCDQRCRSRLKDWQHHLMRLCTTTSMSALSSRMEAIMAEVDRHRSPSCGHVEVRFASLTGCNRLLCEGCDRTMQDEIISADTVLECPWCRECCSILLLPRQLTVSWAAEWQTVTEQVAIIHRELKCLIDS